MTLTFALLVASFLLYVECMAANLRNNNNNYQSLGFICYFCTIICSTILFNHFFIK